MARISKTPGVLTEEQEQMLFVQWLAVNKIPCFHCPNEVGGSTKSLRVRAIKMKKMGVSKGVPDLFVFIPVRGITGRIDSYQMCVIEMKRQKKSVTSPEQKAWLKILELAGIPCAVCKGAEAAIQFVKNVQKEIQGELDI